jgi:hypothetical protein
VDIDKRRRSLLDQGMKTIHKYIAVYSDPKYVCQNGNDRGRGNTSFECGSMLEGALLRQLRTLGLYEATTKTMGKDLHDISFKELRYKIRGLRRPRWFSDKFEHRPHSCHFGELQGAVDTLTTSLELKDYISAD